MAAAAGWDWVAPAVTAAALATAAAVVAATHCWLALCSGFSPPDPPKGSRHRPYTAKGGGHCQ
jgi:hypothetical protein